MVDPLLFVFTRFLRNFDTNFLTLRMVFIFSKSDNLESRDQRLNEGSHEGFCDALAI